MPTELSAGGARRVGKAQKERFRVTLAIRPRADPRDYSEPKHHHTPRTRARASVLVRRGGRQASYRRVKTRPFLARRTITMTFRASIETESAMLP
jgi:hypothetical protein